MLRQNRLSWLFFESLNRGLFRLRSYVGVVLKHLVAYVSSQAANGLFGNIRALGDRRRV